MTSMKKNTVGVIVGRFQTPILHAAHHHLLEYVLSRHEKVLVLLGVSPAIGTKRDPMDFETRKLMILGEPLLAVDNTLMVEPIYDTENDATWSAQLDTLVRKVYSTGKVTLYGGRDSFIPHYTGKFETQKVKMNFPHSATAIRTRVKELGPMKSTDFRCGAIYTTESQYPRVFMTVDIAITKDFKVLLGKKPGSDQLRFPGGFVDPTDDSLAYAAAREMGEEAPNIEFGGMKNLHFIGSRLVEDWRYRGTGDRIMTSFFHGIYSFGDTKAGDDLAELGWYLLTDALRSKLCDSHKPLFDDLMKSL